MAILEKRTKFCQKNAAFQQVWTRHIRPLWRSLKKEQNFVRKTQRSSGSGRGTSGPYGDPRKKNKILLQKKPCFRDRDARLHSRTPVKTAKKGRRGEPADIEKNLLQKLFFFTFIQGCFAHAPRVGLFPVSLLSVCPGVCGFLGVGCSRAIVSSSAKSHRGPMCRVQNRWNAAFF